MTKNDRGLTAEDAKLDALLKAARPTRDSAHDAALLDRIVAAAEKTPRLISSAPAVAVTAIGPAMPEASPVASVRTLTKATATPPRRRLFAAGGLLAASLVAGLVLGQLPYAAQTVTRFEQATGLTLATASDDMIRTIAAEFEEEDL